MVERVLMAEATVPAGSNKKRSIGKWGGFPKHKGSVYFDSNNHHLPVV